MSPAIEPWHVCVPLMLDPHAPAPWPEYAELLNRMGVERVFLSAAGLRATAGEDAQFWTRAATLLHERIAFLAGYGIRAGFWLGPTLGWDVLGSDRPHPYQELVGPRGEHARGVSCPLDTRFQASLCRALAEIAHSGVDMILLEDDFRLHLRAPAVPMGCFCPLHLADLERRTGVSRTREEVVAAVLSGPPNPTRDAFLASIGDSLLTLARALEAAVHAVNPTCRIGPALVMSHWSHEGLTAPDLLKTLAGPAQPFARTIGAPYWANESWEVGFVTEYTRLQEHWLAGSGADLMAEGDPFPHTRFFTPAATQNAYEEALLAAGFPGVFRYPFAYAPRPTHEMGYIERSAAAKDHYRALRAFFPPGYQSWGVDPALRPNAFASRTLPEHMSDGEMAWPDEPLILHILPRLGLPIGWDDAGPAFLQGDASANLSQAELERLCDRGCVVDAPAARFLMERGIDVGLSALEPMEAPRLERYGAAEFCGEAHAGDYVWLITTGRDVFYRLALAPGAQAITWFCEPDGRPFAPGAVHYEDAGGRRYCILPFDVRKGGWRGKGQEIIGYCRQAQLARSLGWVARRPLPAVVEDAPNIHLLCRAAPDGSRIALALQNLCLDPLRQPVITLRAGVRIPDKIELLLPDAAEPALSADFGLERAEGTVRLHLPVTIPPMGLAGVGLRQG